MKRNEYISPVAIHPGELIKEWLEDNGMTSKEFAIRTGKPEKTISHILNGKSGILKDVADSFEIVTGIPSDYILRFQAKYDADVARRAKINPFEQKWDDFGVMFPYRQMVKSGWVEKFNTKAEKMRAILSFFALTSEEAFLETYTTLGVSYRHTGKAKRSPYAVAAWVRQGQLLAGRQQVNSAYSKSSINGQLNMFMGALKDGDLKRLRRHCQEIGIKLVFVENIPEASISGAAYWYGGSPIIQLSGKGKSLDKLIFNFFHELGHIYNGHKGIQVDDIDEKVNSAEETTADEFARKAIFSQLKSYNQKPTVQEIELEAERIGLPPCVVLGYLTHRGLISYAEANSRYKDLQQSIEIDFKTLEIES